MTELSLFRLYLLRALYLLIAVGLGMQIWPGLLQNAGSWGVMTGVANCLLAALTLMAALGVRYPLQMLPILLFELTWKVLWLGIIALPMWLAGPIPANFQETVLACSMVVIVPFVIPWRYVFANYVTKAGDRWTSRRDRNAAPSVTSNTRLA